MSASGRAVVEPECRKLGADDFGPDGLPNWDLHGPLEIQFTLGPVNGLSAPHWLARYSKLPAYLGVGGKPSEAVESLELALTKRPLYRVAITHHTPAKRRRFAERMRKSILTGYRLREGKFSDFAIDPVVKQANVRKADALKIAKEFRDHAGETRAPEMVAEYARFMAEKTGEKVEAVTSEQLASFYDDVENLSGFLQWRHHPWEMEYMFARWKMPALASGIYS